MKLRATKSQRYATRALRAGDEFDASLRDAKILMALGRAEEAPPYQPPVRPRTPAPAPAPARSPEPESESDKSDLSDMTVEQLRAMAEARGFALPTGYVRRDDLLTMLGVDDN